MANGDADLVIHQVSEILPVAGVVLAGTLPPAIQNLTTYGVGLPTAGRMRGAAAAFAARVRTSEAAAVIREKGMEPVP